MTKKRSKRYLRKKVSRWQKRADIKRAGKRMVTTVWGRGPRPNRQATEFVNCNPGAKLKVTYIP